MFYVSVLQIWCILNGYKIYGKPKFPTFTWSGYRPKWNKFLELIEQLEKDRVHGPKHDCMYCEIACSGMWVLTIDDISGFHHFHTGGDDTSDAGIGSGDKFGIILD